jgi:pSer/pThr/pTyr-binding forkhead associated (FHA) protein
MRTWIIGSGADCDLVVARPTVSGRHCCLTETADGYLVEDLGSSNGTFVNRVRISSATRVSAGDTITLGLTILMPWPVVAGAPGVTVIRIGRDPDNDVVLNDSRVSGHHARLLVVPGSKTLIEDLGSSNGTFVNSPDQRVTQAIPLTASDVVYFGSLAVPAARLLTAQTVPEEAAPPRPEPGQSSPPPVSPPRPVPELFPELSPAPALLQPSTVPERDGRWAILLLAQAPVLAILIVLIFGRHVGAAITEASWGPVAHGIAATTFALAISALWLGGSLAAWASVAGRSSGHRERSTEARPLASPGARLVTLVVLCVAQCMVLLAVVYWGSGLRGDWPAMFGVLVMASAAGLLLGLAAFALIRIPALAVGVLVLALVPMIALGGWIRPLAELSPAVRLMAAVMPSRWAFEGLLLLESEQRPSPTGLAGSEPIRDADLAEGFFPAKSERMGPTADATALGCLLVGLAAAAAFISGSSKPSP